MHLPPLYRVEQEFPAHPIADVPAAVRAQFAAFDFAGRITPGQSVAVAVASRGTHDLQDLVVTSVKCLRELGLRPFIIPAMGSHGGATGPGQAQVLRGLGISEETTGAPLRASMEVVSLGRLASGAEVFFAQDALSADHIMVINRVKPHTIFRAEVESGLCKIMAVGLGRQIGAATMHRHDLAQTILPAARLIMARAPLLCGLAVTENALGGTEDLALVPPERFAENDREFLRKAWALFPRLPVEALDLLIVEEMGKDISGAGMDPNVIGFWRRWGGEKRPFYKNLVVLDLTPASHGNATGMGMADLTTERFMALVDRPATNLNALTSGAFRAAMQPLTVKDDRQAIEAGLSALPDPGQARVGRILNTHRLGVFWVSRPVAEELAGRPGLRVGEQTLPLSFDQEGRLQPYPR
ncbi:MAG: hypothetical protein C4525_13070 [Desulfarculus sp.]|jgi:hypothetical protein|nr:MAG: hypothetical protein C4525_13070 [Desulfarculus sp.]